MTDIIGGGRKDYERVFIDQWIKGQIREVEIRKNHEQKYTDRETKEQKTRLVDQVRFVFDLEGYDYPHNSRWMTFSTNEKSNLFKKYLSNIAECSADAPINLTKLKGLKVKTMWNESKGNDGRMWQYVEQIRIGEDEKRPDIEVSTEDIPQESQDEPEIDLGGEAKDGDKVPF